MATYEVSISLRAVLLAQISQAGGLLVAHRKGIRTESKIDLVPAEPAFLFRDDHNKTATNNTNATDRLGFWWWVFWGPGRWWWAVVGGGGWW